MIGDLNNYLSQAYGAGVDPARPSTVSTLYPLSALTLQALTGQSTSGVFNPDGSFVPGVANGINGISGPSVSPFVPASGNGNGNGSGNGNGNGSGVLDSFSCAGGSNLTRGQARVISVQPGRIVARQANGNQIVLSVAACSNLNAVQQNVTLVPQSNIYYKGYSSAPGMVKLHQLTCA